MWLSLSLCIYSQVRRWARSVPFILWPGDSGHWRPGCGPATEATEFSATYSHVFEIVKNFEGELRDRVSEITSEYYLSKPLSAKHTCSILDNLPAHVLHLCVMLALHIQLFDLSACFLHNSISYADWIPWRARGKIVPLQPFWTQVSVFPVLLLVFQLQLEPRPRHLQLFPLQPVPLVPQLDTPGGERNSYHQVTPADHILLNY